jgi:hypothetical protein
MMNDGRRALFREATEWGVRECEGGGRTLATSLTRKTNDPTIRPDARDSKRGRKCEYEKERIFTCVGAKTTIPVSETLEYI